MNFRSLPGFGYGDELNWIYVASFVIMEADTGMKAPRVSLASRPRLVGGAGFL